MEKNLLEIGGGLTLVPQVTLYADVNKGQTPSFTQAMPSEQAHKLFEEFIGVCAEELQLHHPRKAAALAHGWFGADMRVAIVNHGPVTVMLEHP